MQKLALAAFAVALVTTPAAAVTTPAAPTRGKTLRVNWVERKQLAPGALVFTVRQIEITSTGWRISGSFANRSGETFKVYRGLDGFGDGHGAGLSVVRPSPPLRGARDRPVLPLHLRSDRRPAEPTPRARPRRNLDRDVRGKRPPAAEDLVLRRLRLLHEGRPPEPPNRGYVPKQNGIAWLTDHTFTL